MLEAGSRQEPLALKNRSARAVEIKARKIVGKVLVGNIVPPVLASDYREEENIMDRSPVIT